jgi:VanZ family protein
MIQDIMRFFYLLGCLCLAALSFYRAANAEEIAPMAIQGLAALLSLYFAYIFTKPDNEPSSSYTLWRKRRNISRFYILGILFLLFIAIVLFTKYT